MLHEIKLKVNKPDKDGFEKEVKELYLVEAELHGEAEKRGYDIYPDTQIDVFAVYRSDVREIINQRSDGEFAYKATVVDTYVDENGKEKELRYPLIVFADDLTTAVGLVNDYLKQGYDMRLDGLRRIKLVDYLA